MAVTYRVAVTIRIDESLLDHPTASSDHGEGAVRVGTVSLGGMSEATDEPTPLPAPSEPPATTPAGTDPGPARPSRRTRRFSLPEHHHEEMNGDSIEAFLEGPPARRRRPHGRRAVRTRPLIFETAQSWADVLRQEAARHTRYGRAMAILVIALVPADDEPSHDSLRRLVEVIGREARETDRAVRDDRGRVLVLLPETDDDEAAHLATRIDRGYRLLGGEDDGPIDGLDVEIAIPRRGTDPQIAIDEVGSRLAERAQAG